MLSAQYTKKTTKNKPNSSVIDPTKYCYVWYGCYDNIQNEDLIYIYNSVIFHRTVTDLFYVNDFQYRVSSVFYAPNIGKVPLLLKGEYIQTQPPLPLAHSAAHTLIVCFLAEHTKPLMQRAIDWNIQKIIIINK